MLISLLVSALLILILITALYFYTFAEWTESGGGVVNLVIMISIVFAMLSGAVYGVCNASKDLFLTYFFLTEQERTCLYCRRYFFSKRVTVNLSDINEIDFFYKSYNSEEPPSVIIRAKDLKKISLSNFPEEVITQLIELVCKHNIPVVVNCKQWSKNMTANVDIDFLSNLSMKPMLPFNFQIRVPIKSLSLLNCFLTLYCCFVSVLVYFFVGSYLVYKLGFCIVLYLLFTLVLSQIIHGLKFFNVKNYIFSNDYILDTKSSTKYLWSDLYAFKDDFSGFLNLVFQLPDRSYKHIAIPKWLKGYSCLKKHVNNLILNSKNFKE